MYFNLKIFFMKKLLFVLFIAGILSTSVYAQEPTHLTEKSFKEKVFNYEKHEKWNYAGDKPAIIDFYADWCAPCKQIAPIIKDLAAEYEDEIAVYKVDTEKQKELASNLGIRALPSILFIPEEGEPQMQKGAIKKPTFEKAIKNVLEVKTN